MNEAKNTTVTIGRLTITSPAGRPAPDAFCIIKARAACNYCVVR
jgi:hypothetical protein